MGIFNIFKSERTNQSADNQNSDKPTVHQTTTVSTKDFDSVDFQNEVKMDYNDSVSLGVKESVSLDEDSVKYGIENEVNVKTDAGSRTAKSGIEATMGEDNFGLKHSRGYREKVGNVEYKENSEISAGYDGKRFTVGQSADSSVKVGNDDAYAKMSSGYSAKFGSGYSAVESNYGVEAKSGPVEYGVKQSNSYTHETQENEKGETVETETATQKTEVSGSVDAGNGVKIKNSVELEHSEKSTESDEGVTEESTTSISSKTRIEVDEEKAGKGAAVMAGVFNATQEVKEAVVKDAFTTTETTKYSNRDNGSNEAEDTEKAEEQAESIEKENAEKEAEAEAEAEKSTKEQVEEDTRVNEELNKESEELMAEHENAMEVDREEYAEELEDNSYDQPGEGSTGLESVDFDEGESSGQDSGGESADNDYDYGYGY